MPPDGWVLDFGNLVLLEYFVNCTGGGRYVCLLIFKRLFCMATTDAGEILPPLHSCSLSEICQLRSRLSAEPFRLIHSFIIRSSAAQDEPPHPTTPPPPLPPPHSLLVSAVPPTGGRAGVPIDPKWNPPTPRAPICQTWQGRSGLSAEQSAEADPMLGSCDRGQDVATHHEFICLREKRLHIDHAWLKRGSATGGT